MPKTAIIEFFAKKTLLILYGITKIGMHMDWDVFSAQLKNHENRKITQNDLKEGGEEEEEEGEDFLCPLIKRMDFSPPLAKLL